MDTSIKRMTKKRLADFNLEETRGWTIDCLLQIEHSVNEIIVEYFAPRDKVSFKKIVLNSSILDFGSKCKILSNIEHIKKSTIENIRELSSIRNAFAHAEIIDNIAIILDRKNGNTRIGSITSEIDVMNSSGKISSKDAHEYRCKFLDLYNAAKKELIEFRKKKI
jgi:hypothetical protein